MGIGEDAGEDAGGARGTYECCLVTRVCVQMVLEV